MLPVVTVARYARAKYTLQAVVPGVIVERPAHRTRHGMEVLRVTLHADHGKFAAGWTLVFTAGTCQRMGALGTRRLDTVWADEVHSALLAAVETHGTPRGFPGSRTGYCITVVTVQRRLVGSGLVAISATRIGFALRAQQLVLAFRTAHVLAVRAPDHGVVILLAALVALAVGGAR